MIIVFPDTITQNTKLTSQAIFVITYLLGLLVTTTSIAFAVPTAPVTSAISKFKTTAQVMDTKPINKATANLFKNANRAYFPISLVAARNW